MFRARFLISMKIYFRYPVNILMTFFEPIMWIAPFYFMGKSFSVGGNATGFSKYTGNSDFIGFLVLGYMVSAFLNTVFWSMGFSLKEEMMQGVLESNWSAPVSRIVLMVSKSTFQFCACIFEVIITGIVCHFAFGFNINANMVKAVAFLIPGIIGLMGLGMIIASLVLMAKNANAIIDISSAFLSGFSGGYFPIKVMPKAAAFISMLLPLTYIYDSTRALLINQVPLMALKSEFIVIIIAMFGFCISGNMVFLYTDKRCRDIGNLSAY